MGTATPRARVGTHPRSAPLSLPSPEDLVVNAIKQRSRLTALAVTCAGVALGGCQDSVLEPGARPDALRPSLATALSTSDFETLQRWIPPFDAAAGVYLLPQACDVWIGHANPEGAQRYAHQLYVVVPEGARVRLVDRAGYAEGFFPAYPAGVLQDPIVEHEGYRVFKCSAEDPGRPGFPVVEPVTDHAGKGDGIMIETNGVTLDLNGFGIMPSPSATDLDARYDNIGIVLGGNRATLTNGVTPTPGSKAGVAFFTGWGHSIELEGSNPTLSGRRVGDDPESATYNIVAAGGMGAKLSSGNVLVENVKNVDADDIIGVGFEVLRCPGGSVTTVQGSHLVGASDGVFVRRCDNVKVVIQNNFISAPVGLGVFVREVNGSKSVADRRLQILNNTIKNRSRINALAGVSLDGESSYITISGNRIGGYFCGVQVFRDDNGARIAGIADNATLASTNSWDPAISQDSDAAVRDATCNDAYAPPGLNNPPTVALTLQGCSGLNCTFGVSATDADANDAVARHAWDFGHLGSAEEVPGAPAATKTHVFPGPGTYAVTLKAWDTRDAGAMVDPPLIVQISAPNRAPVAEAFGSRCIGMVCTVTADASDADGDALTYGWAFGANLTATGDDIPLDFGASPTARTAYSITLTATDPGGLSGSVTRSVLLPNQAPVAGFTRNCAESGDGGWTCTFTSTSSDPDGDAIPVNEWALLWTENGVPKSLKVGPNDETVVTVPMDPGTYTMKHGVRDANETAADEFKEDFTLAVPSTPTRAGQTITFAPPSSATALTPFTVSATSTSGLTVSIAASGVCTISGGTVSPSAEGTCTLTATQAGDATYNPALPVVREVAVAKANQTIAFTAPTTAAAGTTFTVSATSSSGLPVTITASGQCTIAGSTVTASSTAGTCTLTAKQPGNATYNAATDVPRDVAIKLNQTVTLSAPERAAPRSTFTVTASSTSGLATFTFAATGACSITTSAATSASLTTANQQGTCTVTATQAGSATYNAASASRQVRVRR